MKLSTAFKIIIGFAVVFILVGLAVPFRRPPQWSPTIQCRNNLKQIGLAIILYRTDHGELFPATSADLTKYLGGVSNVRLLFCPTRLRSMKGTAPIRISELPTSPQYAGYDSLTVTSTVPGMVIAEYIAPVMCDKPGNHGNDGINILYADGHVSWWPGMIEEYAASNSLVITVNTKWLR